MDLSHFSSWSKASSRLSACSTFIFWEYVLFCVGLRPQSRTQRSQIIGISSNPYWYMLIARRNLLTLQLSTCCCLLYEHTAALLCSQPTFAKLSSWINTRKVRRIPRALLPPQPPSSFSICKLQYLIRRLGIVRDETISSAQSVTDSFEALRRMGHSSRIV